jgi:hypothetical protein
LPLPLLCGGRTVGRFPFPDRAEDTDAEPSSEFVVMLGFAAYDIAKFVATVMASAMTIARTRFDLDDWNIGASIDRI